MVFPLLPVIQIFFPSAYRPANSISEITGIPFSRIIFTRWSIFRNSRTFNHLIGRKNYIFTDASLLPILFYGCSRISLYLSFILPLSDTNTSKPCFCASTADPAPLSPAPKYYNFPFHILSDLQCHNAYYCKYYCHYPEPCYNFRFRVALFLIMVMEGSHKENPPAFSVFSFCSFKPGNLHYHR